jgi:hypothetical protein
MDVCINSQIQSPLVRTLAQTKGKSASFTLGLADNVPPCSFSKIEISTQNPGETQFGRSYKLKVPQYGYLRDVILRYTTREAPIKAAVAKVVKELYSFTHMALDDVQVAGSHVNAGTGFATAPNVSWFNLQNSLSTALTTNNIDSRFVTAARFLAPQFSHLISGVAAPGAGEYVNSSTTGPNGTVGVVISDISPDDTTGTVSVSATPPTLVGLGVPGPYTQLIKINGNPAMWSSILRFYYNVYQLANADIAPGGYAVKDNKSNYLVAKMIWSQLQAEGKETTRLDLHTSHSLPDNYAPASTNGVITQTADISFLNGSPPIRANTQADVTLPPYITSVSRGGKIFLIPKLPQLQFDAVGTLVGVKFVPLHLLHPNDNSDQLSDMFLTGRLSEVATAEPQNFKEFPFNPVSSDTEWKPWDWQTESQMYPGLAANVAERVVLSTHNRPIQTVFPQEVFGRVQRMPAHERYRFLKMMKPRISKEGKCGVNGQAGEKTMYLPLLLHSTENPSFNFDTRFVEQLDIDVVVNALGDVFAQCDIASGSASPLSVAQFIESYMQSVFPFEWKHSSTKTGPTLRSAVTTAASGWSLTDQVVSTLAGLETVKAVTEAASAFDTYSRASIQSYVLSLRTAGNVPDDYIKVEALLYYHNFHDATAQAIRDSNFKPGEPASILAYNTYQESERIVKASELQNTDTIHIPITSNNLIFGTYFMIKRRRTNLKFGNKRDHLMQTLPIKQVTLTASGQQIYSSNNDELALTDSWDYDLATGKVGRKYINSVLVQSRDDVVSGESFYLYYIPFSFSSDMTYNSGSLAFQTLNNPMLSISIDVGKLATQAFDVVAQDNEWSIRVFHNYWNMLRIDSNTGSITKSLDL